MAGSIDMRAGDLMSAPLVTCESGTSLGDVAVLLHEQRIHAIVVLDDAGAPSGIVSDTDLLAGEWLATDASSLVAMRGITAGEMMTVPLVTIDAESAVEEVADAMRRERVGRLVVTRAGEPVGIVAVSDLVRQLGQAPTGRATVGDVMSHGIVVCRGGATIHDAARAMTDRRSRSVVVVDPQGRTLGIVTGFDLLDALIGAGSADTRLSEVMRPPIAITPDATLRAAADLMLKHETHRLVVVDSDEPGTMPLGLISTSDIVAEMAAVGSAWRD